MVRKKGVFAKGYNSSELRNIDAGIRGLVVAMNKVPYIVTIDSCQGHDFYPGDTLGGGMVKSFVGFEVYYEPRALRLFRRVLKGNWTGAYPDAMVSITREYSNLFEYNFYDLREPLLEDRLIWNYNLSVVGFGKTSRRARTNLNKKNSELVLLLEQEAAKVTADRVLMAKINKAIKELGR